MVPEGYDSEFARTHLRDLCGWLGLDPDLTLDMVLRADSQRIVVRATLLCHNEEGHPIPNEERTGMAVETVRRELQVVER